MQEKKRRHDRQKVRCPSTSYQTHVCQSRKKLSKISY